MKPKQFHLCRDYDGLRIYYGFTGWTHRKRGARLYGELQAIELAERMSAGRASPVYVQPAQL